MGTFLGRIQTIVGRRGETMIFSANIEVADAAGAPAHGIVAIAFGSISQT
jgi:hypothetical protein